MLKAKQKLKVFYLIFALVVGCTICANFNNVSIAIGEEEKPNLINFELRANNDESTYVTASDGINCYKVGDLLAVDLYLTTPNAYLNFCKISVSCSNRAYLSKAETKSMEISQELKDLNLDQYVIADTSVSTNGEYFIFDSTEAEGVYLTSNKELKLATFYFTVQTNSIGNYNINEKFQILRGGTVERDAIEIETMKNNYTLYASYEPAKVKASCEKQTIQIGEETQISATVYEDSLGLVETYGNEDEYGQNVLQNVTYTSSDSNIVKVYPDGTIRGMNVGSATITVTSIMTPAKSDTVEITVQERSDTTAVTSISFANDSEIIQLGKTMNLNEKVTIAPLDASDKTLKFESSNTNVATVNKDGILDTVSVGETTITVYSSNNKIDIMTVKVENTVTGIKITNPVEDLNTATIYKLEVEITGNDDITPNLVKYKTSDEETAIVKIIQNATQGTYEIRLQNVKGTIGKVKVTAYLGDVEDSFYVYFSPDYVAPTKIEITNGKAKMAVGDRYKLETTISPYNASKRPITFTSSDESIATVDSEGNVAAVSAGCVTIKVKVATVEESYNIEVVQDPILIDTITLDKNSIVSGTGSTETINVTIGPEDTTEDKTFICSSSDTNVASVSQSGNAITVNCKKPGSTTITVEHGEVKATCDVTVYGITFKGSSVLRLNRGESSQLEYEVSLPNSSESYNVTFESSKPNIASVDQNGLVTAIDILRYYTGSTITATLTTLSGKSYTATTEVIVYIPITKIELTSSKMIRVEDKDVIKLNIGDEEALNIDFEPLDATNPYIDLTIENTDIATLVNGNIIQAVSAGRTFLTAKAREEDVSKTYYIIVCCDEHTGGTVTCSRKAVCDVCGEEYGEFDENNHAETEVRDAVEATSEHEGYTGDTYCKECGTLIKHGEVIPVIYVEEPKEEINEEPKQEEKSAEEEKKTEEEKQVEVTKEDNPKTGDSSNIALWITLFIGSGISIVTILKSNSKRSIGKHSK